LTDTHPIARFEWRTAAIHGALSRLDRAAARRRFFVLLFAGSDGREPRAGLLLFSQGNEALAVGTVDIPAAASAAFMLFLPISAAFIETSLAGYERLMWFAGGR